MTSLTFPKAFKDEVLGKEPLNTSQMRQPTPHISEDLRQHKNKQITGPFPLQSKHKTNKQLLL